jgi:hypothetical protein
MTLRLCTALPAWALIASTCQHSSACWEAATSMSGRRHKMET